MQRFRVRQAAGSEPKPFIEADGVDDQRTLLPVTDRTSVIAWHLICGLADGPPIRINDPPVAVAPAQQHKNASQFSLLDELKSIGHEELARAARRQATGQRII